jgi:hypothetical protein
MSKLPFTYVFSFSLFFIFLFSLLFFSSHFSPPLLIYSPPLFSLSAPTLTGSLRPSSRCLCLRRRCPIAPHHHPSRPAFVRRCPAAPPPSAARGKAVRGEAEPDGATFSWLRLPNGSPLRLHHRLHPRSRRAPHRLEGLCVEPKLELVLEPCVTPRVFAQ